MYFKNRRHSATKSAVPWALYDAPAIDFGEGMLRKGRHGTGLPARRSAATIAFAPAPHPGRGAA